MKTKIKYLLTLSILFGIFNSCETIDMDLRVSPNDLASDQADPNLLLNSIQLAYASNMTVVNDLGSELTRIDYMFGRDYFNNYPGSTLDGVWERTYSSGTNLIGRPIDVGIFSNLENLKEIDEQSEVDYSFHIAVGKTLKAHMLMILVDYLGKAVLSEAGNPNEFPAPKLDEGRAVYDGALTLLDEAEALFAESPSPQGVTDFFYQGDSSKWLKLVNTLRLRAYVTTGNSQAFEAVISDDNYISEIEDDFQFNFGTRELQPDTRHQDYAADYTPSGANIYQSNWLMEYMLDNDDPRIRYYFYRQVSATPGADAEPNEETLACSLVTPPQHFLDGDFTYCAVPNGYWGRSHGNNEGTPPDSFLRTAVGVYPAGGRFDDNSFGTVGLGKGGGGAGIEPIILSSYVYFWRSEIQDADPVLFRTAIEKSIEKVQGFGSLDSGADLSVAADNDEVEAFIDEQVSELRSASGDEKWNVFARQYFVASYGDGVGAYNFYRRTGFPTTLTPNWSANPGPFPRSFLYPQTEVITNPNLEQKSDLTVQVFWDTNPASPSFPPAN